MPTGYTDSLEKGRKWNLHTWLKEDAVFGVKQSLIADFKKVGGQWQVEWDFVLSKE